MENMEIEKVAEEVIENVQEIIPTPTMSESGVSTAKIAGVAAVTYGLFEAGKFVLGKVVKSAKNRKAKKESNDEDVLEFTPVIDEIEE